MLSNTSTRNPYTGNGTTNVYPYTFKIWAESELRAVVLSPERVPTVLTLGVDYTVSGVKNAGGGNVTLKNAAQNWIDSSGYLKTGWKLFLRRVRALKQETDVRNQGAFYPEIHEDEFDKEVMIDQQQQDELDRALKQPETETPASLTLPFKEDRASKFLAFDADGNPIASSGGISGSIPVSAFIQTLLDDANAAAARATLGAGGVGGTWQGEDVEDGTLSREKFDSTTTTSSRAIFNMSLAASVAANALTIALKNQAGSDPGAASPVYIPFRHPTAGTGTYNWRKVTSAKSTVISSGSTGGHSSGVTDFFHVYAIDAESVSPGAGVELAWSSSRIWDENSLQSTTAEGGAGGADSRFTLYSTTARANVPIRYLGYLKVNQVTAGTHAAAPTEISTVAPAPIGIRSLIRCSQGNGYGAVATAVRKWSVVDTFIGSDMSHNNNDANNGMVITINTPGLYWMKVCDSHGTSTVQIGIAKNSGGSGGTQPASLTWNTQLLAYGRTNPADGGNQPHHTMAVEYLVPGDTIRVHGAGNGSAAIVSHFEIARIA